MKIIPAQFDGHTYPVYIGPGSAERLGSVLQKHCRAETCIIVSNRKIFSLHGKSVISALSCVKSIHIINLPDGEQFKNAETLNALYTNMIRYNADRKTLLIALGGGVIGDITGFAAATYMRGIRYVQIPTTLLSMVDSSIGGKTGIDHPRCKNLIGCFYTPECVLVDPFFLKTLPEREMICGLAEVIKYGVAIDSDFYSRLQSVSSEILKLDFSSLGYAIRRCCVLKNKIVSMDPYDRHERKKLNFGHTFAHAMESAGEYKIMKHGEAVLIGMMMAVELSALTKKMDSKNTVGLMDFLLPCAGRIARKKRIAGFLKKLNPAAILNFMQIDKKNVTGNTEFVLLHDIGKAVIVNNIDPEFICRSVRNVLSRLTR